MYIFHYSSHLRILFVPVKYMKNCVRGDFTVSFEIGFPVTFNYDRTERWLIFVVNERIYFSV